MDVDQTTPGMAVKRRWKLQDEDSDLEDCTEVHKKPKTQFEVPTDSICKVVVANLEWPHPDK